MSSFQPTPGSETTRSTSVSGSARDGIRAANDRFMAAAAAGDAAAMAAGYTLDGQLLPPHSDFIRGQEAITNFWHSMIATGIAGVRLDTTEVETEGDLAVEVGRYTVMGADGGSVDAGKYVAVWHREGSAWKLHRDIWTTSRPAAAA